MTPKGPDVSNEMFRPPIHRSMKKLDRSLFSKSIPLAAAKVRDRKQISKLRHDLNKDTLKIERLQSVQNVRESNGQIGKALLLQPTIQPNVLSTYSTTLSEAVKAEQVDIMPFDLNLDYDFWDYHDIMSAVLPEEEQNNIPTGFSIVGHVVHLNLREGHLPYKHLIATVLLDKHPNVRTVINKIENVGSDNPYRTFAYELLAGDPDLNVEVSEEGCVYRFDYSKVYWNSRLHTEHQRLVNSFQPSEAICDVMAGIGPFAVPAGKKRCWVMANDLNPDSYTSLKSAIERNKVGKFVQPFNVDGNKFIERATQELLFQHVQADVTLPVPRHRRSNTEAQPRKRTILTRPRTFNHYVLNLPASALTFLHSFIGVYAGLDRMFYPNHDVKLPLVHVYCFSSQSEDAEAEREIVAEITRQLEQEMKPAATPDAAKEKEGEVSILDVRQVAPNKRMFCATFRLPATVAFRTW